MSVEQALRDAKDTNFGPNTAFVMAPPEEYNMVAFVVRADPQSPWEMREEIPPPLEAAVLAAGFFPEAENAFTNVAASRPDMIALFTAWGLIEVTMDQVM